MRQSSRVSNPLKKRRTTFKLPVDLLTQAQRIARSRNVTLSTVISEALSEGLRTHLAAKRSDEVLRGYQKALSGFSEEEMAILLAAIRTGNDALVTL